MGREHLLKIYKISTKMRENIFLQIFLMVTEMQTEPMKVRKRMLLIECFPDIRFSAKALFLCFTHTSKFLLNETQW